MNSNDDNNDKGPAQWNEAMSPFGGAESENEKEDFQREDEEEIKSDDSLPREIEHWPAFCPHLFNYAPGMSRRLEAILYGPEFHKVGSDIKLYAMEVVEWHLAYCASYGLNHHSTEDRLFPGVKRSNDRNFMKFLRESPSHPDLSYVADVLVSFSGRIISTVMNNNHPPQYLDEVVYGHRIVIEAYMEKCLKGLLGYLRDDQAFFDDWTVKANELQDHLQTRMVPIEPSQK